MLKLFLASAVIGTVSAAPALREVVVVQPAVQPSFEEFKLLHSKVYTGSEHEKRAAIFHDNVNYITEHNRKFVTGASTYELGVNPFSDMSHAEFKAMYVGPKIPVRNGTRAGHEECSKTKHAHLAGEADAVDWRSKGAVTPVKNQGQCGACWSFSTTGSMEGRAEIAGQALVPLSEQQLVDCSTKEGDSACDGGLMDYAFQYVIDNGGLDTEADYPYIAATSPSGCDKSKAGKDVVALSGFKDVKTGEDNLAKALATGPVSVAIEADQRAFQSYKSGVFTKDCGTKLDHAVLAVGYGADYWIVKNSWGPQWGMSGFIELGRSTGSGVGTCGLATQPSYPVIGKVGPSPPSPSPPSPSPPSPSPPSGGAHYEDPNTTGSCSSDEDKLQLTGVDGTFCSPRCSKETDCPTDVPKGTTATPTCALVASGGTDPTNCALICDTTAPWGKDGCPADASCKSIQGTGLCTYDK